MPVYGATSRAIVLAVAVVMATAGCGLQTQAGAGAVKVTVTKDFGARQVSSATVADVPTGASAVAVLQRRFSVKVGPRGTVRAIGGVAASGASARWALYLNGIPVGPRTRVHGGDRLWWDLEDASARPRAVVGSFPEPFLHGLGGKRYPTTLECADDVQAACRHVAATLGRAGVAVSSQLLGTGSGQDSLTIVVGTWRDIRPEVAAALIARGPGSSGVFARFLRGRSPALQLLDKRGVPVHRLRPSAGLVAALTQGGAPPTWLLVGTDVAGVSAAARALGAKTLRDDVALAVSGAHDLPLPR